ncbi:hypothetical protein GGH94_003295 [Coemansia aciculifera]|uniref:RRM domain-containing protein n=1 Tax=Coemansia aciculifera TaxID=417176 RepID=A0A9W8IHD5_9FUNG|nr:hypothetical protein GGH94_003295 [Coemansia aciculifera]KAJ2873390.1 hypothetical protein GGH93_003254 [Coemansia aciculifera]
MTLFVGHLVERINEKALRELFSPFGTIANIDRKGTYAFIRNTQRESLTKQIIWALYCELSFRIESAAKMDHRPETRYLGFRHSQHNWNIYSEFSHLNLGICLSRTTAKDIKPWLLGHTAGLTLDRHVCERIHLCALQPTLSSIKSTLKADVAQARIGLAETICIPPTHDPPVARQPNDPNRLGRS